MNELLSDNGTSEENKNLPSPVPSNDDRQEDLEVRSTEVQEIIGRPPHWLVRGGIAAFMAVLALIFIAASVIKYPEVITAPLKLTAINAPKTLESEINGKLVKLRYDNNERIEEGAIVAWLESTADHQSVIELSAIVDSMRGWLQSGDLERFRSVDIKKFSDLGELQSQFQSFEQAYREFITYLPGGFYSQQREILKEELEYNRRLLEKLKEQKAIQEVSLELAQKEYEMQKQLSERDLTAPIDLEQAKSDVAASRLPLKQTESSIINNRVSQAAKKKELMELNKQIKEQRSVFLQALNTMKSAIDDWKSNYLVISPIEGQLVYAGILQENQTLQAGQIIGYVQPNNTQFFGQMAVSQRSFGKIEEGQQVLVRFSGYPDHEFGSVTGEIGYLSEFPVQDSVFMAKVNFPNEFTTNYGRQITPVDGMRGQAEIITQDMRFVERIYNNLTKELR